MDYGHKCKTIKPLGKKRAIFVIWDQAKVLDLTPKVQSIKGKVDKMDFIKIKNFGSAKYLVKRIKNKLQTGRKYCQTTNLTKD